MLYIFLKLINKCENRTAYYFLLHISYVLGTHQEI